MRTKSPAGKSLNFFCRCLDIFESTSDGRSTKHFKEGATINYAIQIFGEDLQRSKHR